MFAIGRARRPQSNEIIYTGLTPLFSMIHSRASAKAAYERRRPYPERKDFVHQNLPLPLEVTVL